MLGISSIDPVAILSVLTSLNLSQTDTIFILVFGESLLNDGIAITVFKTLVARFDGKTNDGSTSVDEVLGALADFFLAMVCTLPGSQFNPSSAQQILFQPFDPNCLQALDAFAVFACAHIPCNSRF